MRKSIARWEEGDGEDEDRGMLLNGFIVFLCFFHSSNYIMFYSMLKQIPMDIIHVSMVAISCLPS